MCYYVKKHGCKTEALLDSSKDPKRLRDFTVGQDRGSHNTVNRLECFNDSRMEHSKLASTLHSSPWYTVS